MNYDVIVIGGGAAGLFCALTAGQRGRRVVVLELAPAVGRKILISGGGRCNFTNLHARPENYLGQNRNFHKSALARYTPLDFVELVKRHHIEFYEKKLGQLFCRGSAREIVEMLVRECAAAGVEIITNCRVERVERGSRYLVSSSRGSFESERLVVATGGTSIPQMGATDFGLRLARQFGLRVVEPRPALVPLTLGSTDRQILAPLSGISIDALARAGKQQFRENILVTHQGLSGPAILQISSYWNPGEPISIDLLPDSSASELLARELTSSRELKTILGQHWPARFAQAWTDLNGGSKPLRQYSNRALTQLAEDLHHWRLSPTGTEGFRKAEVMAGGVDTAQLSSKNLECRHLPGLHFNGEVVDVTGHLGGYHIQWAWDSVYAA
ncbi:MAG: NAD(P)/FAD-dependent oxidoreductase, partial [Acidobacteriota bacterium]